MWLLDLTHLLRWLLSFYWVTFQTVRVILSSGLSNLSWGLISFKLMVKYQNILIRILRNSYYNLFGKFKLLLVTFMTHKGHKKRNLNLYYDLSDVKWPLFIFGFISGITYGLTRGQGEFLSFQQYYSKRGKVGEGWKGRGEGCGKWVEPADLPTPQLPVPSQQCSRAQRSILCRVGRFAAPLTSNPFPSYPFLPSPHPVQSPNYTAGYLEVFPNL